MTNTLIRWFKLSIALIFILMLGQTAIAQTAIDLDSTNVGEITSANNQASFVFSGEADQTLTIELSSVNTSLLLQAIILDGSGGLVLAIGNPSNLTTIRAEVTLPTAGDYTVLVTSTNNQTGEFIIRVRTTTTAEACETYVLDTLEAIESICQNTGRNQACVGNLNVDATPAFGASGFTFEQVGDIVALEDVDTFQLTPFNSLNDEWGVVFMLVQANIPNSLPGQNVSMLLMGDVAVENRAVTDPDLPIDYRPMQAFYFTPGIGSVGCDTVPDSGILIDTPEGDLQVSFNINDVVIDLGSTAFLSFSEEQTLDIDLIEGSALVSAENQTQLMLEGQRISVPINEEFLPSAPPNPPVPIPERLPDFPVIEIDPSQPPVTQTVAPIATTIGATETSERPPLPTTGQCVLRTFDTDNNPNVRSGPSTEFQIVSFITPDEVYEVIGRTAESDWYQISTGWIAGFVTERGGDCTNIPVTYIPPTATPMPTPTLMATTLPVAGSNSQSIIINAETIGQPITVSGAVSSPMGVDSDTLIYNVVNARTRQAGSQLNYSVTCSGTGVEDAFLRFGDGSIYACNGTLNFIDMGFNEISQSLTVYLGDSAGDAYVSWSMSFTVIE